jgi:uncharacterized protein YutE (UPF0331/DUF86 family)
MSSIDPLVVSTRICLISDYLEILKDLEGVELEEYLADIRQQLLAERLLEIIIQAAIDINRYILKFGKSMENLTNEKTFLEMGQSGIISPELAHLLASSGGFRNILAHQYLQINHRLVFDLIQEALELYPLYCKEMVAYLELLGTQDE